MKQSKAIQMLHWLEELKRLEAKGQQAVLTQREQYRIEELRARVEERLAERQASQQQKQEQEAKPPRRSSRLLQADVDERKLRETGDQRAFLRKQAIVTQYDSFSSLPYAQVRQAPTRDQQMSSPMPSEVPSSPEHHQHSHPTSHPSMPGAPAPKGTDKAEETSGDFDVFDLFHPPESLK